MGKPKQGEGYNPNDCRANPASGVGPYMGVTVSGRLLKDRVQQFLDHYDVENECRHGNIPGLEQRVTRCRCFETNGDDSATA